MKLSSLILCLFGSMISSTALTNPTTADACTQQTSACKHHVALALNKCQQQHGHNTTSMTTICEPAYELETDTCYNKYNNCKQQQIKRAMLAAADQVSAEASTTLASSRKALGNTKTIDSSTPGNS